MIYVNDIIDKCGGKLICGDANIICDSFSKDTRTINSGDVYIGIKGKNFDGNVFYDKAFDNGAKVCILDNIDENEIDSKYKDKTIIKVDNTISCLQKLAMYKRSLYNIPVIAVTGSVGKTSTKDMIASVLEKKYKVLKTEGNNNNHIGLPLTILRLKDEEVMVLEMGMNNKGEIALLSSIARPTIGVITNIGTSHIGNLGSRENILAAKLELVEYLKGPLVINNDNDMLHDHILDIKSSCDVVTFGIDNESDYMASNIDSSSEHFLINGNAITCSIGNRAFIYNSLACYAVGALLNESYSDIKKGIKDFKLTENRLEYKKTNEGVLLIDDTYNASLDSIKSSLEILRKENGKRKIAVIGDILELGKYSRDIHIEVGKILYNSNLDIIITIGEETRYVDEYLKSKGFEKIYHFSKENDCHIFIKMLIKEGDVVLLKGSHGINLKNIVTDLLN